MIDTKQRAKQILEEYANYYSEVDVEQLAECLNEIKAEAYKEFVNKIKVHAYYIDFPKEHRVVDEDDIDNILKELEDKINECQNK